MTGQLVCWNWAQLPSHSKPIYIDVWMMLETTYYFDRKKRQLSQNYGTANQMGRLPWGLQIGSQVQDKAIKGFYFRTQISPYGKIWETEWNQKLSHTQKWD